MHLFGSCGCSEGGKLTLCLHSPLVTCVTTLCCSPFQKTQHMYSELVLQAGEWLEQGLNNGLNLPGVQGATQGSVPLLWSLIFLTELLFHSTGNTDKGNKYSNQRSSGCSLQP